MDKLMKLLRSVDVLIREQEVLITTLNEEIDPVCNNHPFIRIVLDQMWTCADALEAVKIVKKNIVAEINQKKLGG